MQDKIENSPEVKVKAAPGRGLWLRRRSHGAHSPPALRSNSPSRSFSSRSSRNKQNRLFRSKSAQGPTPNSRSISATSPTDDDEEVDEANYVKIVLVGDGGVGKTSLVLRYQNGTFPQKYTPTICENFNARVHIQDCIYNVTIWDTAGQEDYDRVRKLSYKGTDLFLVCFAIDSVYSLHRMVYRWLPEIKHYCPKTPFILVGCKRDLRNCEDEEETKEHSKTSKRSSKDTSTITDDLPEEPKCEFLNVSPSEAATIKDPVSKLEGRAVAKQIKALDYVECSALTAEGVQEVVELATTHASQLKRFSQSQKLCVIM